MREGFNPEFYGEYRSFLMSMGEDNSAGQMGVRKRLSRAIKEELTPRQMQMVTMYYIEGMKMADIAAALGVNKSTVSRTISRGRERLRRCLRYGAGELL
ncbi:MAG: RNA polymerase sigma factor [Oscillospiraceae bacterium]